MKRTQSATNLLDLNFDQVFPTQNLNLFSPSFSFRTEHILGLVDIRKRMAKNPSELLKEQ